MQRKVVLLSEWPVWLSEANCQTNHSVNLTILLNTHIWALASALAPSGKESPRENEDPVFYLVKKYYS